MNIDPRAKIDLAVRDRSSWAENMGPGNKFPRRLLTCFVQAYDAKLCTLSPHFRGGRFLVIAVLALAALLAGACNRATAPAAKEIQSYRAGDLVISLLSGTGDLAQGQNNFVIAFRAANNQPVDAGAVTLSASMSMPGMAPMTAPIELRPAGQAGRYDVKGDFAMSGAWHCELRWDGPARRGSTSFSCNVR